MSRLRRGARTGRGLRAQRVGVIVSGGNVDAARYGALLAGSGGTA